MGVFGICCQFDMLFLMIIVMLEEFEVCQLYKFGDVFVNDVLVLDNSGVYSVWVSYMMVCGMQFDWQNGYKIDGLLFVMYGIMMLYEQFDCVELLKGFGGFLYGFVMLGGVVNYVMKQLGVELVCSVDIGYWSINVWIEYVDFGQCFGFDYMFGVWLNVMYEEGKMYNDGNICCDSVLFVLQVNLMCDLFVLFGVLYQDCCMIGQMLLIFIGSYLGGVLFVMISGGLMNLGGKDQYLNMNLQFYMVGL